jgi:phenylacetate-CoA ligase
MDLYELLIRHVTFPLYQWRSGASSLLGYARQYERTQFLAQDELQAFQQTQLAKLLEHAYRRCPYYRLKFKQAGLIPSDIRGPEDIAALPVLEKEDIQQSGTAMVAEDWPCDDLIADQTGGSTGRPVAFFYNHDCKQARAAATIRHNRWAGWDLGTKVAFIWGAPRDLPNSTLRWRLRNSLLNRHLFLDAGHLNEKNLLQFHQAIKKFRPRVITGYSRALALMARFAKNRALDVFQPQAIVTSAEVLEPSDRTLVEQVFNCPVFDRYGCREVGVIASECPAHEGLHTMAEGLLVEIVRGSSRARPGETGSILITDLRNFAMPLIRYRIGDLASWQSGHCSCGRQLPRLGQIAGRSTDFVVGSDGRLVSGVFLATYVVAQRPSLGQVQIRQEEAGRILFRIQRGPSFLESQDLEYLTQASREHLGEKSIIEFEYVEELAPEASGKYIFCRSTVVPAFLQIPSDRRMQEAQT